MAIRIEQPGAAKAAAKAGAIIGKGKRAEEERARAEREQAQKAQEKARQAALEWEQKKMQMRSEQAFQQELADKQWDYEKFNRARAWDIEKMEMRSRLDFEKEEKKRAERDAKYEAGDRAIVESDNIYPTPEAKEEARWKWWYKNQTGLYPPVAPKAERPPSKRTQVSEIEAARELDITTPEELRELGLDPADFPGVGREVTPEEVSGYEVGQLVSTPQGDMTIVGFDDDGEPLVESVYSPRPGGGGEFRGTGATGEWEVEPRFPFRKVGSLKDVGRFLKRPVGSIKGIFE
jgi:hypothetical protein